MRGYRKKNGFNSVARVIKTMLPDTPLTMNLKNQDYMQIILAGKKTLEERFAEVDSKRAGISKRDFDVAGHYSRPDIFTLSVNTKPQSPVEFT